MLNLNIYLDDIQFFIFLFMNVIRDSSLLSHSHSHLVAVEVLEEAVRVEMYGYCFVSSLSSMASYNHSDENVKTEALKPNKEEPDSFQQIIRRIRSNRVRAVYGLAP